MELDVVSGVVTAVVFHNQEKRRLGSDLVISSGCPVVNLPLLDAVLPKPTFLNISLGGLAD